MIDLLNMPPDRQVKIMTVLLVKDASADVDYTLNRMGLDALREFAKTAVRLLAEAKAS